METIVIGHRNPDMDAIVSALGYAELKRLSGETGVIAGRCGNTNERIDYVLAKFGVEPPVFFGDMRPRVSDVMERNVVTASVGSPVYQAMLQIGENRFRGLPVVDDQNRCVGLISSFKISRHLFPPPEEIQSTQEVDASVSNLCTTIHGKLLCGDLCTKSERHILVVAAMYTASFRRRIESLDLSRTVLIVGDRFNIQHISIEAGVKALVVTGGMKVGEDVLAAARKKGTIVISSPYDTATTVLLARSSVTAEKMLYADFDSIAPDMPLEEARREVAMSSQFAFPVVGEFGRLEGILSKSDFLKAVPRQLILVDHNELSQAVKGAESVPIVEILDHHRIGAVSTDAPILFMNRPVGSTSTIVATSFEQAGIPIPKPIAGILMAGLISDTLNLSSPTTTDVDRRIMATLAEIAGIEPIKLAEEIFSVGSPLLTMTPDQAVTADCKEYEEAGVRFSAAQIEELSFSHFPEKKEELIAAVEKFRDAHGLLFSALLITDINTQNSVLIVRGGGSFTKHIDYPEIEPHLWQLDGIVSRKKQLLPYLTSVLARLA
ncbi:MAG TPA: putative manganese-dependent inorganic diphosphatase [Chthoniobacterales bacterium]|nr:putative manganese-dependent inorganic diphosphatase [Chthoniobacterales bacterium]